MEANYFDNEQCVFTSQYNGGHSAHFGEPATQQRSRNSNLGDAGEMFKNPVGGL